MKQYKDIGELVDRFKEGVNQDQPDEDLRRQLINTISNEHDRIMDDHMDRKKFAEVIPEYERLLEFADQLNNYHDLIRNNGTKFTASILFNLGCCYKKTNRVTKAIETFEATLQLEPITENIRRNTHYNLGTALAEENQFYEAREHLIKAREDGMYTLDLRRNLDFVGEKNQLIEENSGPDQTLAQAKLLRWELYGQTPCG